MRRGILLFLTCITACDSTTDPAVNRAPMRAQFSQQSDIEVVSLGTLGGNASIAVGINDRGQVIGYSRDRTNAFRPFIWEKGRMRDLGTISGPCAPTLQCIALGINQGGDVVGQGVGSNGRERPTLWPKAGEPVDLGTLGGCCGMARGISDGGQIVGQSALPNGQTRATLWKKDGSIINLGTLGGTFSGAHKINARGEIVGTSTIATGALHGFFWSEETGMVDLGPMGNTGCVMRGINNKGQASGCRHVGSLVARVWTVTDGQVAFENLPPAIPNAFTNAWQISEADEVVGATLFPVGTPCCAALWTRDRQVVQLGSLGGRSQAYAINNQGDAVGESFFSVANVGSRATLWRRKGR